MPSRINAEDKVRIVREYLNGRVGLTEAAKSCQTTKSRILDWVRKYKSEGVGTFFLQKNRTYSKEVKEHAVKEYLSGGTSLIEVCKKYKIRSETQLRNWIKVYNGGGDLGSVKRSGGGSYMKQGRETTQAERIEIAKACIASGKNYGEIALKYRVSYQQARSWTLKFEKEGESGLEDRRGQRKKDQTPRNELEEAKIEIERLKHQLYLAEMERDLLKKLDEVERRYPYRK